MITLAAYQRYAADPSAFRDDLLVDVSGTVQRFGDVMDEWQHTDFTALDPALMHCAGRLPEQPVTMRAWLERARGHSKTTDLAVLAGWALTFATRPLKGFAYAADRDQAKLLHQAIATLIRLNPWLSKILSIESHRIVNIAAGHPAEGATLTIEASDVGSSYGILADFIIADEVTHWEVVAGEQLWQSLISSAAKRTNCLMLCIQNSGFVDSWQWQAREQVRTSDDWYFSRLDGPVASWMTPARLAEQEKLLPPVAFARLWLNQWSSGGGDLLTEADITAAFKAELGPIPRKQQGFEYVAGLDLGVSRDASAICVLGVCKAHKWNPDHAGHGRIRLAATKVWRPLRGQKVSLQQIENSLVALHQAYRFKAVNYDPWQASHMSQRLELERLPMVETTFTPKNLQGMATAMIESFADRRVDLYPDDNLKRDLKRMRVEEKSYGFRIVAPHDAEGHGDLGTAFSLAMLAATEIAGAVTHHVTAHNEHDDATDLHALFKQRQQEHAEELALLGGGSADDTRDVLKTTLRMMRDVDTW